MGRGLVRSKPALDMNGGRSADRLVPQGGPKDLFLPRLLDALQGSAPEPRMVSRDGRGPTGSRHGSPSGTPVPPLKRERVPADNGGTRRAGGTGARRRGLEPGATTMRIRRKEDSPSEPTGDTLTLEREEARSWARSRGPTLAEKPVVEFEAPPVDTTPTRGRLGQVLVSRGVVTESQVAAALTAQADSGKRLGEVLVDIGALDERGLANALADFFGMPVTDLRRDTPTPQALALVPAEIAREHLVIPLRVDDDGLHVAVAQPSDDLRFLLADISGQSVRLSLAPMTDIRWAIDRSYQAIDSVGKLVQAFEAVETTRKRPVVEAEGPTVVAENAPVVQVVDNILTQAVRDRASDVHIEPSQDVIYVRFRIDGALKDVLELPSAMGIGLVSRIKIMAEINIVEKRRSQDGQFTTDIDGKDTDVRVATVATIWGEKVVMRILDKNRSVLRLNDLGHADRHPRDLLQAGTGSLRHGAVRRPDGKRQDDHALRHPHRGQRPRPQRHDD